MKIEKINENQIRCTIMSDELSSRKITLDELSYGSEKAKNLFHDMMAQAKHDVGFDANGSPLMIEAIPMRDRLVLNITKVTDPEELDTRFSSFSNPQAQKSADVHLSGADAILNLIKKATEAALNIKKNESGQNNGAASSNNAGEDQNADNHVASPLLEAFRFMTLDDAILGAKAVDHNLKAKNSLYKFENNAYILIIHSEGEEPEMFNKTCNILSEYSSSDHVSDASENFLREHGYLMIADNAIQKLSQL